jgi:hypothetical protein
LTTSFDRYGPRLGCESLLLISNILSLLRAFLSPISRALVEDTDALLRGVLARVLIAQRRRAAKFGLPWLASRQ